MKTLQLLKELGFDVILFIAGIAGGVAFLPKNSTKSRWEKFASVVSGGFAANYLTPVIGKWLSLTDDTMYGLAFLVGYGGLKSVELSWQYIELKLKGNANGSS